MRRARSPQPPPDADGGAAVPGPAVGDNHGDSCGEQKRRKVAATLSSSPTAAAATAESLERLGDYTMYEILSYVPASTRFRSVPLVSRRMQSIAYKQCTDVDLYVGDVSSMRHCNRVIVSRAKYDECPVRPRFDYSATSSTGVLAIMPADTYAWTPYDRLLVNFARVLDTSRNTIRRVRLRHRKYHRNCRTGAYVGPDAPAEDSTGATGGGGDDNDNDNSSNGRTAGAKKQRIRTQPDWRCRLKICDSRALRVVTAHMAFMPQLRHLELDVCSSDFYMSFIIGDHFPIPSGLVMFCKFLPATIRRLTLHAFEVDRHRVFPSNDHDARISKDARLQYDTAIAEMGEVNRAVRRMEAEAATVAMSASSVSSSSSSSSSSSDTEPSNSAVLVQEPVPQPTVPISPFQHGANAINVHIEHLTLHGFDMADVRYGTFMGVRQIDFVCCARFTAETGEAAYDQHGDATADDLEDGADFADGVDGASVAHVRAALAADEAVHELHDRYAAEPDAYLDDVLAVCSTRSASAALRARDDMEDRVGVAPSVAASEAITDMPPTRRLAWLLLTRLRTLRFVGPRRGRGASGYISEEACLCERHTSPVSRHMLSNPYVQRVEFAGGSGGGVHRTQRALLSQYGFRKICRRTDLIREYYCLVRGGGAAGTIPSNAAATAAAVVSCADVDDCYVRTFEEVHTDFVGLFAQISTPPSPQAVDAVQHTPEARRAFVRTYATAITRACTAWGFSAADAVAAYVADASSRRQPFNCEPTALAHHMCLMRECEHVVMCVRTHMRRTFGACVHMRTGAPVADYVPGEQYYHWNFQV